jgi:lantibiotic biosynthesis protein
MLASAAPEEAVCYVRAMTWKPIVERVLVASVLTEIVDALEAARLTDPNDLADYAVMRRYLDSDHAVVDPDDLGGRALAIAVDTLAASHARPSLFGGAAGVGWTIAHHIEGNDAEAVGAAIDTAIAVHVSSWPWDDLITGLVGFGVYALERGQAGVPIARAVLARLEAHGGRGWVTSPLALPPDQRSETPNGCVNLGVAHGTPGMLSLLAEFCRRGIERDRASFLLERTLRHLLDNSPQRRGGRFAPWLSPESTPSARLAWCYGDLGVAAVLLGVGRALDHCEAHDEGLSLALNCASRSLDDACVAEAGICHGAAGVAHLFNRMAQATGLATLHEAAVMWIDHTLAMRTNMPFAGFPARILNEDSEPTFVADASLLSGASGVGLVLHAASSSVEPEWDRILLLHLPPHP